MAKRIRPAKHYQRANDPVLRMSRAAMRSVARELRHAFGNLSTMVPKAKVVTSLRHGRKPAAVINWHHYREVLRGAFDRLGKLRAEGGALGARQINGSFAQARRKVRFRKYDENEPRDDRGRWTVGGVASAVGEKMVQVHTAAVDEAWSRDPSFYVGPGGVGETASSFKYDRALGYIRSGGKVEVPSLGVQANGRVGFTDGRHRFAAMRDSGMSTIPVSMDRESIANARAHGMIARVGKSIAKATGDQFQFDSFSPAVQRAIRDAQDQLIQQLESDARDAIDQIINDGTMYGTSLDEIADNIKDMIGLTDRQSQAVLNYQRALENLDSGALQRGLRNPEYDAILEDSIDAGTSLSDEAIANMVDDYIENYLDYRAATIAQTESTRAANLGLHDAYSQAIERGALNGDAVTRQWQLADAPCPICESIPDNNPDGVGVDESFDSDDGPIDDPPVHPNCECSVDYVTDLSQVPDDSEDDFGGGPGSFGPGGVSTPYMDESDDSA